MTSNSKVDNTTILQVLSNTTNSNTNRSSNNNLLHIMRLRCRPDRVLSSSSRTTLPHSDQFKDLPIFELKAVRKGKGWTSVSKECPTEASRLSSAKAGSS